MPGLDCKAPNQNRPSLKPSRPSRPQRPAFVGKEKWRNTALPDQIKLVDSSKSNVIFQLSNRQRIRILIGIVEEFPLEK